MRLFVAIDVPDVIKGHLAFLQRSLDAAGLRHVHPKNIHLTLNFLGEQKDAQPIIDRLRTVVFEPFTLRLSAPGFFPSSEEMRVLWVGLEDSPELLELQRAIDVLFTPKNSFRAHLTLSRMRLIDEQQRLAILRAVDRLEIKPLSFKVTAFKLYMSTLTPLGPVYEVLETFRSPEK